MVTVSGANVAVGFNDSQTALLALTAGGDLTGYAYSTDGGASFTDGGALPNAPGFVNFGDPWLAHDRAGRMYFSNLALDGTSGNLDVGWRSRATAAGPGRRRRQRSSRVRASSTRPTRTPSRRGAIRPTRAATMFTPRGMTSARTRRATSRSGCRSRTRSTAERAGRSPKPKTRASDDSCTFKQYIRARPSSMRPTARCMS